MLISKQPINIIKKNHPAPQNYRAGGRTLAKFRLVAPSYTLGAFGLSSSMFGFLNLCKLKKFICN